MKLALFGATGRAGRHVLAQALARGHEVTALARDPQKLSDVADRVEVVQGDVQDAQAVARVVSGADAVLSVLGPTSNEPDYQVTRGTEHILAAMKEHGVQRLVLSAGAGVGDANDAPGLLHKLITVLLKLFSRHVYEDMKRTVQVVRASDVDWTIVRAPMLTDDPGRGDLKVGYIGKGPGARLSRADMATFMLDEVQAKAWVGKAPVISN